MNYEIIIARKGVPWEIRLPKNIKIDIHKQINHPIVYDRFQKKAFCLACGEYFDYGFKVGDKKRTYHIMPKFRADAQIQCPLCGHTARAWPHTRPVFTYRNFVTARAKEDELYVCFGDGGYRIKKEDFENLDALQRKITIYQIIKISRKEQVSYGKWGNDWARKNGVLPAQDLRGGIFEHPSFLGAIKNSFLKYSFQHYADIRDTIKSLELNAKYPQLEYLEKAGLKELERDMIWDNPTYIRPNWNKKTLSGILGLSNQNLDKLRQWDMFDVNHIAAMKEIVRFTKKVRKTDLEDYFDFFEDISPFKTGYLKGLNPVRSARYLKKVYEENRPGCSHGYYGYSPRSVVANYVDYLQEIKELGYPMTDYYLYPKDFAGAHEESSRLVREKKDELMKRKKRKAQQTYEEKYLPQLEKLAWENGAYIIRPLRTYKEFSREGAENNHCVATYYDRATEGKTSIFVIRRKSEPEAVLVTVEMRDGKLIQCRGKRNCTPDPDILAFAEQWIEEVVNAKKKRKVA